MNKDKSMLWIGRGLIGIVFLLNIQAAILFMWQPQYYRDGFELNGIAGNVVVQGIGLLFVMRNVPYLVALIHPRKYRISLYEAIAMQAIGFLGETALLLSLPEGHAALSQTALRFMLFDGPGLVLLLISAMLTRSRRAQAYFV